MIYLVSNQLNAFESNFNQIALTPAIQLLVPLEIIGADTETQGLDCYTKDLLTIQLGNAKDQIVFDIQSYNGIVPQELKDFLNNSEQLFIFQNAKFDLQFLYKQGIIIKHVYDTFLAETVLTIGLQEGGRALDDLVRKYCPTGHMDKSIRGQIITKGLNSAVISYAANDVVYLETIMNIQIKLAKEIDVIRAIQLDNEFVKVLAYIEFCGIKLNWEKWKEKSMIQLTEVYQKKLILEQWLKDNNYTEYFSPMVDMFTGERECILNWDSPKQVIKLFESLNINCTIIEKGVEKKSIEKKALRKYIPQFPLLKLYFDYKGSAKDASTYGLNWRNMINPVTGRIHTSFKQIMNTGRLSSGNTKENKPNLQNLPSDELTRSCFISEPGYKYIAADYDSQESIILANFSRDENLLGFYKKGFKDMHSYVTFLLFPEIRRCSIDELTNDELIWIAKNHSEKRTIAKTAEFAIN